ncbi:hypothetical protein FRB90_004877 [Tulasnella sp. 427]|nr:hypothetical protein FRB90_004877 [Tulasnella sp. 427]
MASTPTTGLGLLPFADASMMLIQQRRSLNATPEKSRDEPREVPKVRNLNNHIAKEARDIYLEFANDIMALEHNLDAFMRAVRPIGSSSGLIYAAMELKHQDMSILRICGSIAGAIWRRGPSNSDQADLPERMRSELIYPVCLEDVLGKLSSALRGFLNSLQDIPEFSDTPLTDFLHRSIEWLDYRADALTQEQELDPERQILTARLRYLCQLLKELSFYIRQVTAGLTSFLQDGVVVLRDAQDRAQNRLQNMSTVATFFSAVTATTLQYSIDPEKFLGTLVGSLWVSSLILSVASAINLQLAMHWRAAMYRSPRRALPAWASFCLDHTPIVFLVAAVLTFSAGLVAWTFSSGFGILVSTSAAALTGLTTVIISTIFAWEAREIVLDYTRTHPSLYQSLESSQLPQTWSQVKTLCLKAATTSLDAVRWTAALMQSKWQETTANIHGHELPTIHGSLNGSGTHEGRQDSRKSTLPRLNSFGSWLSSASRKTATPARTSPPPATLMPSGHSESSTVQNVLPEIPPEECIEIPASLNKLSSKAKFLKLDPGLRATIRDAPVTQNESRREELKALRPTRTLPVNHNVKDDISFSPDGNRLAISTIERQVLIWDVMELSEKPVRLPAPTGRFAWSLDGSLLLSVLQEGFRVWDIKDLKDVTPFPTKQLPHTMAIPIVVMRDLAQ